MGAFKGEQGPREGKGHRVEGTRAGCLQEAGPSAGGAHAAREHATRSPAEAPGSRGRERMPSGVYATRAGRSSSSHGGHTALAEREEGSAGGQFSGTADAQLWKAQGSAS